MSADLLELLQRNHDDITRALDTLLAPTTPTSARLDVVYELRLAAAVHSVAEASSVRTGSRTCSLTASPLACGR